MKTSPTLAVLLFAFLPQLPAQTLLNLDFGVGSHSLKTGLAAAGQSTNDFWNLYRHYDPKFVPGTPLVADGLLRDLKLADGAATKVSVAVRNAPGVWGNSTGDAMYDNYIFANNGSNITVTIQNLEPGRYHFYLYGHADADVIGEQNSAFTLRSGTNTSGPLGSQGATGWKATLPWQDRYQYVVFRDVAVLAGEPVVIEAAPGPNGVAVINGMQISSRGTSPPQLPVPVLATLPSAMTNLIFHKVHYAGTVGDNEARFSVELNVESLTTNQISAPLFEGDVALLAPDLPDGLRIVSSARNYQLVASAPGAYSFKLDLAAKVTKAEPWNQISFTGPNAAIASVTAEAGSPGFEMQLLSGTQLEVANRERTAADAKGEPTPMILKGFLGADRTLSLRWQSKTAETARKSLVTVETTAGAQVTPTVIKYTTQLRYEILQAAMARLTIALPTGHALTKLQGDQIRDWRIQNEAARQLLIVEFLKPVEKSYDLTLFSEQPLEAAPLTAQLTPPQPVGIERESGSFSISSDDMLVEIDSITGLRQVNATGGALAAYRFYGRPFALAAKLRRIEPILKVADRVTSRLEETRLLVSHALTLNVEKAGIYSLELSPQAGFIVSDVRGEGVEDWKAAEGKLHVSFSSRVLGARKINVQLEQPLKTFPPQIVISPLGIPAATNETAQVGAASALGIRLKTTGDLAGLREIPISSLPGRSDELLAFAADQAAWTLTLAAERLPARVVAEVFDLVAIGDGLVGGSATIRYGLINQGVQAFKIRLPAHWKNVEFTGPNIRRKELDTTPPQDTNSAVWRIALQDKAWGGYTLVITYDYQFDPKKASLDLAGAHAVEVERETGSIAITTAASLKLEPRPVAEPLRAIDSTELAETDRALISRSVLLAYRYAGGDYHLTVDVNRHQEVNVLDAVADRTQITSVLTEAGQMLTQASFMVKNNDRQFQKFRLPAGAKLWGCDVNNQPTKAESDGDWLAVSLPRGANRDEAFAVDIVYEQKLDGLESGALPKSIQLAAPKTDVPNTYAEWELHVPPTERFSNFGGNMTVLRGTTYGLRDAWLAFSEFYTGLFHESGGTILAIGILALLVVGVVAGAARQGWSGVATVLGLFAILAIMAGMLLPSLAKAKAKAARISAVSNLKQIGLAARIFAQDNGGRLPTSLEEMKNELGNEKVRIDPATGQEFIYTGAGKDPDNPNAILAYSPVEAAGFRTVCFVDGHVDQVTSAGFIQALQRDAGAASQVNMLAQQTDAVRQQQIRTLPSAAPSAQPSVSNGTVPPGMAGTPGIRSLRFSIPRTGQAFTFTKVLNVSDEPLSVRMSLMKYKWFRFWRSLLQLLTFLGGLLLIWRQWRRAHRSSFWLTVGFALALGSFSSLLIAARVLHFLFIMAAPALLLLALIWLTWRYWPRTGAGQPINPSPEPTNLGGVPPALATLAFLALLNQASGALPQPTSRADEIATPTNAFVILSGNYTGVVGEKVAQFDATLAISTFATNQTVPLFGEDAAIESFSTKSPDAKLLRQGGKVALRLGERGNTTVQFKLVMKLSGDVSKRRLAFSVPPALSSVLAMKLAENEADVEFPAAISLKRTPSGSETRVEAILGSGDWVEMFWTPRVKRATEVAASVFVQNSILVSFGSGAVNTKSMLDYQITQGELRQVKVRLPAGQRLLRVEGDLIRTWELNQDGPHQLLTVDLVKSIARNYRLTVETERLLDTLPALMRIEAATAQDVIRETGIVAIQGSEELSLSVDKASDVQRVDASEFGKSSALKAEGAISAYRFLKPGFELAARVEAIQPQVEANARNAVRIGFEQVSVSARIDYTIKKVGVFALNLALPPDYRVESVTGSNVAHWIEKSGPRVLEVALKERTMGAFTLSVDLSKAHRELPKNIEVAGVTPLDTHKLTGAISVSSDPGVSVRTTLFEGLMEIPAASLGEGSRPASGGGSVLAYKFIGAEPSSASAWRLSVATEAVDSWVRAEIVNLISVSETLASGRAIVHYEIMNAPAREFRLKTPTRFKNIEISGASIRRRELNNGEWRVELQNKVRGSYSLVLSWEESLDGGTNHTVEIAGVEAPGVERETGSVVLMTRAPLQVIEKAASEELVRIDARELPDWAGVPSASAGGRSDEAVLAYRYLRPGYRLVVEARRFQEAAVLQALVDSAHLTTVVADDGQMMTQMALTVRNNGLQYLEVELPPATKVWSAFVAGQPVRPSQREGKLLVPLERSGTDEAPVPVELTFASLDKFPRAKGKVKLLSPRLGAPLKNARWDLYLPPEFDYSRFEGTMAHEAEAAPVLQIYSSREYKEQEQQKRVARKSETQNFLTNARNQLASGNLKSVNEDYQRFNSYADAETRREFDSLKKDLGKANSGNLIQAQRAYTFTNNTRYGAQPQSPAPAAPGRGYGLPAQQAAQAAEMVQYDAEAAERQWEVLQRAQEVSTAKIQPLRVNLPTRGQRHSFSQILQTEINKPMTIQFEANNTMEVGWIRRVVYGCGGFVALWLLVAAVVNWPARPQFQPAA